MHELSIAQGIVAQLTEYLRQHPAITINQVILDIGKISGVNPESLEFAFPLALETANIGTPALVINIIPVTVNCQTCGANSMLENFQLRCGQCASTSVTIASGRELKIKSLAISEV
jgi:hydrogenase nickel incorporation protein HypA/HybF